MTLRHMQIFLEVVRQNSMSAAARALYISQPTVSQVITEIEAEYNLQLFERSNKRLHITEAGQRLVDYTEQIINLYTEMERVLRSKRTISIKIGATLTVGASVFSDLLLEYRKQHPNVEVSVVIRNTSEIEALLLAGKLDLALVEGSMASLSISYTPVMEDFMVLVAGAGHRFFGRESVCIEELHNEPFVLREKGSGTREFFETNMKNARVHLNCTWECLSMNAIKHAVIAGHGLTVISKRLIEEELARGLLWACDIKDYNNRRTFGLVHRKDRHLSPQLKGFIALLPPLALFDS